LRPDLLRRNTNPDAPNLFLLRKNGFAGCRLRQQRLTASSARDGWLGGLENRQQVVILVPRNLGGSNPRRSCCSGAGGIEIGVMGNLQQSREMYSRRFLYGNENDGSGSRNLQQCLGMQCESAVAEGRLEVSGHGLADKPHVVD
jgi:hypothetical protein